MSRADTVLITGFGSMSPFIAAEVIDFRNARALRRFLEPERRHRKVDWSSLDEVEFIAEVRRLSDTFVGDYLVVNPERDNTYEMRLVDVS